MNKPLNGVLSSDQTVLLCRVQSRLCGLPLAAVEETLRPQPVRPLAAPVAFVQGLARIRGGWSPVVDLAGLLGLAHGPVNRYVVTRAGDRRVALAVSEVLGLRHLPAEHIETLPPLLRDRRHEAVAALAERDQELIAILDQARLLPDEVALALPDADVDAEPMPGVGDSVFTPSGDLAPPAREDRG